MPPAQPPQHSWDFRLRRFANWFPMGLTYAFLYMGRYNLTVSKNALGDLMTKEDFGIIFAAGTITYAFSFLINGPLTDRIGGRKALLIGATGSAIINLILGFYISSLVSAGASGDTSNLRLIFAILYSVNMYFQSYGAVAIVKVNANWFHRRERGGFSGIFGAMISSGIFLAFTGNNWILDMAAGEGSRTAVTHWVFFAPSVLLFTMAAVEYFLLRDTPEKAGHENFDVDDADSKKKDDKKDDDKPVPTLQILKRIFTDPIIITVALIEFCTGVLRNGVMHWYPIYAKEVLALPGTHYMRYGDWGSWKLAIIICFALSAFFFVLAARSKASKTRKGVYWASGGIMFLAPFMGAGWGGILMVAGVIGGNVAGWVSDLVFQSRRAPTAGLLYIGCAAASIIMLFTLGGTTNVVGWSGMDKAHLKALEKAENKGDSLEVARLTGLDTLHPGDKILSIAGIAAIKDWSDISRAVACVPPICLDSEWDVGKCMCVSKAEQTKRDLRVSRGTISAIVMRDGQEVNLQLNDRAAKMRAGDKRQLKAGPVLILTPLLLGIAVFFISLCVIGTHGLLSGTATMDFGGRKGAATAVGMIDGFVYLGTGVQSFALGFLTTRVGWQAWPVFLFPFAIVGLVLLVRIWHAVPTGKKK